MNRLGHILCVILYVSISTSVAQSKADSSFSVSAGMNYNWDYYDCYSYDIYQLTNKFSSSFHVHTTGTKWLGARQKFGLSLQPHIGVCQIAFNAIIPTTDFDNPADSVGWRSNDSPYFYRRGKVLAQEKYTYRINYLVWGSNLHFDFKLNKKLETSLFFGFLQYIYANKNSPDFSLHYMDSQHSGVYTRSTKLIYYEYNFWRTCGGIEVNLNMSKRLQLNILAQTLLSRALNYPTYIQFMLDGSGARGSNYMRKCFSLGVGAKFNLIRK